MTEKFKITSINSVLFSVAKVSCTYAELDLHLSGSVLQLVQEYGVSETFSFSVETINGTIRVRKYIEDEKKG